MESIPALLEGGKPGAGISSGVWLAAADVGMDHDMLSYGAGWIVRQWRVVRNDDGKGIDV